MNTYQDAIAEVQAGGSACRSAWVNIKYIALGMGGICIYSWTPGGVIQAYWPTQDDQHAKDWIKGGDRPPS